MSSTWATRLSAGDSQRLRFYITIQGLPDIFQTSAVELPSTIEAVARPRRRILANVRQGGSELDLNKRRMIGGSLRFDLHEDDVGTLADLFATRSPRTTYIGADHTAAATTVTLGSNALLDTSGTLYCMGETITWTGKSGGTQITGCTRGAFNSRALTHFGDATAGESVYLMPLTWQGRRVYLYAYFENEDGTTTTDLVERVGTFSIESNPTFQRGGVWALSCSELTDEVAKKVLGRGVKLEKLDEPATLTGAGDLPLPTWALNKFVAGGTGAHTYALAGDPGAIRALPLISVDADSITVGPDGPPLTYYVSQIAHIAVLSDSPGQCLAWAAISRLGNAANGAFDIYPGREHTEPGEPEWAFGAGIDAAEVDTASFGVVTDGTMWMYVIADEHSFEEMLDDFTLVTGTFWRTDRDGKLAVKRLDPASASAFTFSDTNILANPPPTIDLDESGTHPRIRFSCNYDPFEGRHRVVQEFNDVELMRAYPQIAETYEVKSRTVYMKTLGYSRRYQEERVAGSDVWRNLETTLEMYALAMEQHEIETLIRTQLQYGAMSRAILTFRSDISALDVELGDVVVVSANVPDLEGNDDVTLRRALVIAKEPRWDEGTIEWRLSLLAASVERIAPAATIQSAAGAALTLRSNSSTYPEASDAQSAEMFAAGQSVRLYDVSAAVTEQRIVASVSGGTLTLTSAPSFVVEADVDYVTMGDQNTTESAASPKGYTDFDFTYQMPDAENADAAYMITRLL